MPNHITNIVKITGPVDRLTQFQQHVSSTDNPEMDVSGNPTGETFDLIFDFDKIVPQPDEVKESIGSSGATPLWYTWCCENWGTKWNAYRQGFDGTNDSLRYKFDTAWDCPFPIFEKLFNLYPDLRFYIEFADEDIGSNCGIIEFSGDQPTFTDKTGDEAFACRVKGWEAPDPDEDD